MSLIQGGVNSTATGGRKVADGDPMFTTLVFGFIAACLALGIIGDSLWSRLSR
jgi:hypothetical protein